jgi:NAD(P)-dependent dehydrogenase (short-subunit alcohol dehydrogenase family)
MTTRSGVVFITGCSSGIGRATARVFERKGWRVWATARDPNDIEALAAAGCRTAALDVTDDDEIRGVIDEIDERDGGLDCLINNASYGQTGAIEDVPLDRIHAQFDVNVYGPVRLVQAALPLLRARDGGTIVNVSSFLGRMVFPFRGAYADRSTRSKPFRTRSAWNSTAPASTSRSWSRVL